MLNLTQLSFWPVFQFDAVQTCNHFTFEKKPKNVANFPSLAPTINNHPSYFIFFRLLFFFLFLLSATKRNSVVTSFNEDYIHTHTLGT